MKIQTSNWIDWTSTVFCVYLKSDIALFLCIMFQNTSVSHTFALAFIIAMNMVTVVYFESMPFTPSCCHKYYLHLFD